MKHSTVWLLAWALGACTGNTPTGPTDTTGPTEETSTTPTGETGTIPDPVPGPELEIGPSNNYSYTVDWTFPSNEARQEFVNLSVNWGEVSLDAWGSKRAPTSYSQAILLQVAVDEKTFVERWNRDELNQGGDLLGFWTADIEGRTLVRMNEFEDIKGQQLDVPAVFNTKAGGLFFLGIADFDGDRYDVRIGTFLVPRSNDVSRVDIGDGDTELTFTAQLSNTPMQTAEVHEYYTADWRDIDYAAFGTDYDRFLVDEMFIVHFENGATNEEITANVHDLEAVATSWWRADIEGDNDIRLELARNAARDNFTGGFTAEGTWLVGARCSTCYGRAPWWLTRVEVE